MRHLRDVQVAVTSEWGRWKQLARASGDRGGASDETTTIAVLVGYALLAMGVIGAAIYAKAQGIVF